MGTAPEVLEYQLFSHLSDRGWAAASNDENQWIQADFGSDHTIFSIITQGRWSFNQWVASYVMRHSLNGNDWTELATTFPANTAEDEKVVNVLPSNPIARYVKLKPQTWSGHVALRWEIVGCQSSEFIGKNQMLLLGFTISSARCGCLT